MEILIIFFLILLNGVFSMSEIALISARKSRLETAAKKGHKNAKVALDLVNSPNKLLSTVQIGITLISILTGIYSGDKITMNVQNFVESFASLKPYAHSIAVGIVVVILTFFSLVLGELLPKRIGLNYPETIAKSMAIPMKFVSQVTAPFIWLLTKSTDFLLNRLNIKPTADGKVTEDEIKAIIKESTEEGEVQEIEQNIVERVFHIGDRKVNSLMTHRTEIEFLTIADSVAEIKSKILINLHSFYPVCKDNLDTIIGVVSLKELFLNLENPDFDLNLICKNPDYLIEQTSVYKALENFKKTKIHIAFIVDEHAIFQGILSLNDILEALVGEASDFDDDEYKLVANDDGTWLVDGQYSLHDFLTYFDMDELTNDYEVTTLNGFFATELGKIPIQGEKLIWNKLEFQAHKMNGTMIDKVVIKTYKE
ncbi:MAG: HlyC/CorC family transporter [Flavobacterium sp.]|nr:HlyC/CorC family transporter [Flavobacterium sp.]